MATAFQKPEVTGLNCDLLSPRQLLRLLSSSGTNGQGAPELIIDLRSRSRYRRGHVPGSHNIPSGWLISGELPDGDLILVGESTRHSAATIDHLQSQGHARRIRHLAGGFGAWQHQDLPVAGRQRKGVAPAPERPLPAGRAAGGLTVATIRTNPRQGQRQVVELFREQPLPLESGEILGPITIAHESWGQPDAARSNGVLLLHGFSGDSHAAGPAGPGQPTRGWWDGLIGPGRAIDTDRFFVVCPNVLGGCRGSTGPGSPAPDGRPWGSRFPALTIRDMVAAEVALSDRLRIRRWRAVIGGSMGGMRAMEWAIAHAGRLQRLVLLATTARCSARTNVFHRRQIEAIQQDPAFLGGDYDGHPGGGPRAGLARARTIARITYGGLEDGSGFVERFDANSYLVLTQAMAGHDVGRGRGGVAAALARISVPTHVVSVSSDRLFPPHSQRELARGIAGPVRFTSIDSHHGHDGFLAEQDQLAPILRQSLA